jgi:hypothetical protein|nr:MAG TPA: hypothetical protein [Caudoviricetes sp.]
MRQIEKIFYDWSDDQVDSQELRALYNNAEDTITGLIGKEKYLKIEELFMDCILMERELAFEGGFRQATALWKEC